MFPINNKTIEEGRGRSSSGAECASGKYRA